MIHGIGYNFSLAPNPSSSIKNKLPITSAPCCWHSLVHASTVPPVASRSSMMMIFVPLIIASSCISSVLEPYSNEYSILIVEEGNFPGFLTGMNPIPNFAANNGPKIKPRASGPTIASGFQLLCCRLTEHFSDFIEIFS